MTNPTPAPEAFSGDDFSNNLVSDLGPLLALFGEEVAKQFMSDSMGWADNIIFAMAPLGIITAIVGAIRVGGPRWLKAIIGRARENRATAEVELMSSTSHEVCELWNGQQVVRITGAPPIRELIYLIPTTGSEDTLATVRSGDIFTLGGAPKTDSDKGKCYLKKMDKVSFGFERLTQLKTTTSDMESSLKQSPVEPVSSLKPPNSSPNISLNIHHPMTRGELWFWAAVATFLQLGVLVYDGFATYRLKLKEGGGKVVYYAFPLTTAGTLALVLGMLLCSYVIESSTIEEVYRVERAEARLLWLQRKATVSDQSFDSYLIFPKDKSKLIRTSRRNARLNSRDDDSHEIHQASEDFNSSLAPEVITIFGVSVSFCGFIIQFIGLRAMHWSASLAQLGVTLIMIVVRAWIRRGLAKLPYAQKLPSGHELDWLATRREHFWDRPDDTNHSQNIQRRLCDFFCRRSPPSAKTPLQAKDFVFNLGVIASGEQGLVNKTDHQRDITVSNEQKPNTGEIINTAQNVMEVRKRLGSLTEWPGPASEKATSVATAIEIVMNTLFESTDEELFWSMNTSSGEVVQFKLRQEEGEWEADVAEIDAALSLWLFSIRQEEQEVTSKHHVQSDSAWLRSRTASRKQSIQLLGPSTPSSRRDMRWWVGSGITRVLEVEEVTSDAYDSEREVGEVDDGVVVTIDSHRVVGSACPAPNSMLKQINDLITKKYKTRQIAENPTSDRQISEDLLDNLSTLKDENRSLAAISDLPLELLFAQHMFSAFMWAFANTATVARVNGQATVQVADKVTSHNSKAWEYFSLQNSQLSEMAQRIQRTGLGSLEEIYINIIPALSFAKKLPEATAVVQLAEKQAKKQELDGRWDQAGKLYLWAFRTCITLGSKDKSAIQATATLVEFLRSISIIVTTRKNQRRAKETFTTLQHLRSNLLKALSKSAGPNALQDLAILYEIQGRTEGYESWKPTSPDPLTFSDDWPEYQWTKLHEAVVDGKPKRVGTLLEKGEDPNSSDILGWTPLHYAVERGDQHMVELLLASSRYLNPNVADISGWTPLHYAARNLEGALLYQSLWEKGAEVDVQGRDGLAPLHCAAREGKVEMTKFLIKSGAKLNVRDNSRRTSLHWAAYKGSQYVVELLMERGADPHAREEYGRTPLHLAACQGHERILKAFLETPDAGMELKDELGRTSLHLAAEGGHDQVVTELLKAGAKKEAQDRRSSTPLLLASREGRLAAVKSLLKAGACKEAKGNDAQTALHIAAIRGHEAVVKALLKCEVDKEAKDNDAQTALHMAAIWGHEAVVKALLGCGVDKEAKKTGGLTALHLAARYGHEAAVKILLTASVDIEARDDDEQTALHQAAHKGHVEVVKLLLQEKADKEAKSSLGIVALHLAVSVGSSAVVDILLKAGADKEAKDIYGTTSLLMAVQGGFLDITKVLLEADADITTTGRLGRTVLHTAVREAPEETMVKMILGFGVSIDARTSDQQTALHLAAGSNNGTILELLLAAEANKEAKDSDGWTPLLYAARWGEEQAVKALLEAGANTEAKDGSARTALQMASRRDYASMAELLLKFGADKEAKDNDQQTALHQAASRGHEEVVRALLEAGADMEAKAKLGQTALHLAAYRGHEKVVMVLLEGSVDKEARDELYGQTALHQAAFGGHNTVVEVLLKAGVDIECRDKSYNQTALHLAAYAGKEAVVAILLKAGVDTGARDKPHGQTPLHQAAYAGHEMVLKTLLDEKVDMEARDEDGWTSLFYAAMHGQTPIVEMLLDAGADKEARTKSGWTALHEAAKRGHTAVVQSLLTVGVEKDLENGNGQTALQLADEYGHEAVVALLVAEKGE